MVGAGLLALVTVDLLELLPPLYLKSAVDVTLAQGPNRQLAYLAIAYFVTALAQGACRYAWRVYLIRASRLSGADLRSRFAGHLFRMPASFFDRNRIGDLMSLGTSDTESVGQAIGPGLLTFADAVFYIMTVPVAMYWLSPQLTLIALIPLPLIPWFVMRNEREIHERYKKSQEQFSRISAMAQESLNGVRVIKAFACEDVQTSKLRAAGDELIRLNLRLARVEASFGPVLDFAMSLGLVLLLFVGGRYAIEGAVTLGTFVAFQRYIQKMVWPMTAIGMSLAMYQRAVASSERLKEVLRQETDVPDTVSPEFPIGHVPGGPWKTAGKIEIRGLNFTFPKAKTPALLDVRLVVEPGARVAFVGSIGSGKSALLSAIPRVYPCDAGQVFIDGIDINRWSLAELRAQIGYVSQEVFLFSESVSANVGFGYRHLAQEALPHPLVEKFSLNAAVHEDVLRLEKGYATRVGERGVSLSGGQKQRISVARALLREPSILILDDAFSSVDVQTEDSILRGLRARAGRNTELLAAHRISTVRDSDHIVVMERGKIAEQGTHGQLLAKHGGIYWRFNEQQRLQADLESYVGRLDGAYV